MPSQQERETQALYMQQLPSKLYAAMNRQFENPSVLVHLAYLMLIKFPHEPGDVDGPNNNFFFVTHEFFFQLNYGTCI